MQNGAVEHLVNVLRLRGWLEHAHLFCSPSNDELLAEMKDLVRRSGIGERLRTLVTVADPVGLEVLLDQWDAFGGADGVWLEQPEEDWIDADTIDNIKGAGKTVWIVSPELHGRTLDLGRLTREWRTADGLCTDYPHLLTRVLDEADAVVHPKEPWW